MLSLDITRKVRALLERANQPGTPQAEAALAIASRWMAKYDLDGLAVGDAHAIVVTSTTPSELTLLHELAHFIGGMDHGPRFREVYQRLVTRFISGATSELKFAWR